LKKPVIGFAGLTHLGLNSAVASAARGFDVIGFHDDVQLVENLNNGLLHVTEPDLPELLSKFRGNLTFSHNKSSLHTCDIVYISVDVPTDDKGLSSLSSVEEIIRAATKEMRPDAILVILCQVPPGFSRKLNWPAKQLFYQVETLIFGRAVDRALNPERFIIGLANPAEGLPVELSVYLEAFNCPILPMRYESAELAKISINMFLVASVTTSNTLAEICENIGADWFEIIPALRLDKRIGQFAYLSPGLGIAGGNLERDLRTVLNFSEEYHTDAGTVSAWIRNSQHRKNWAWLKLNELILSNKAHPRVALLGLTYKENTHSLKNSPAIELLSNFKDISVTAFDPAAPEDLPVKGIIRVSTMNETLDNADVLIIMTPWEQFKTLSIDEIERRMAGKIVIDPYRILDGEKLKCRGFTYASLGQVVHKEN
jgi:UDPglucose 6-dehydrogenase